MRAVEATDIHPFVKHFFKDLLVAGTWSYGGNYFGVGSIVTHWLVIGYWLLVIGYWGKGMAIGGILKVSLLKISKQKDSTRQYSGDCTQFSGERG